MRGGEPGRDANERCRLILRCSGPAYMRFLSTELVGAWRNGGARALGAAGA